jgi:hypothetical protein
LRYYCFHYRAAATSERPEQMAAQQTRERYEGREGLFYTFMGMSKQKRVKLISLLLPQSNQQHDILYTCSILFMYMLERIALFHSRNSTRNVKFGLTVKSGADWDAVE